MPDIDIDFADRIRALDLVKHIKASRLENNSVLTKHNTGVYLQEVPYNVKENLCDVPYNIAEEQGFFKIDFLNVNLYQNIKNEEHLLLLLNHEPMWELLEQDDFVNLLFHVNGHSDILKEMKPKSIEQLAAVLAMIRPAKRYLVGKDWNHVMKEVWKKPENDDYFFKKSHATAYASVVVVQMNLICESISYGYS
jgi:DNA polymerase III alpha subunit